MCVFVAKTTQLRNSNNEDDDIPQSSISQSSYLYVYYTDGEHFPTSGYELVFWLSDCK